MDSYIEKAVHNENFLKLIEQNSNDEYLDWKTTVIFYAALHYMNAFLRMKGVHIGHSHEQTDDKINPNKAPKKVDIP